MTAVFHRQPQAKAVALLMLGLLAACGGGSPAPSTPPAGVSSVALQGIVNGGQSPVVGAAITLFAAGQPAGAAATSIATTTTDGNGHFSLKFFCSLGSLTPNSLLYVVSSGGDAGGGTNSAIDLMAALGLCQNLPASVNIDEVTTVAAGYALNGFDGPGRATQGAPGDTGNIHGNSPGLANAMATAKTLADVIAGTAADSLLSLCAGGSTQPNCGTVQRLNALANSLASCVNSTGASSTQCTELFDCAAPGATFNGANDCTLPAGAALASDTLQALISIVRNPGLVSQSGVYDLATRNVVFTPTLAAAPTDWTLALNYSDPGLSEPTATAIDAAGNVWIANYNGRVVELDPIGLPLSPAQGYTGGGLEESFGIAIDAAGLVWVSNEQSPNSLNSGLGSLTELGADGSVRSGATGDVGGGLDFPQSVAVDASDNIWVGNTGNPTVTEFSNTSATPPLATGYAGGGLSFADGLAFDSAGNLWIADSGADRVSEFTSQGVAISTSAGYIGGGLAAPDAIAVDQQGNIWVANFEGASVTELDNSGTPLSPAITTPGTGGFRGGGLSTPGGIAIDGAGNVWVTNYHGASLSELAGAAAATIGMVPGAALSPASGFTGPGLAEPYGPAIDSAGNLWTANFANDSVTEFIGVATPVATPLIGPPKAP